MHDTLVKPVDSIVEFLSKSSARPDFAVVLGSGVQVLEQLHNSRTYMYKEVFGIGPSVEGHTGSLTIGQIDSAKESPVVAIFRGRFHLYEGHDWSVVTLPTQVVSAWGIPRLLLTNAAGGLNKNYNIGDLMVVTGYRDHLNPKYQQEGLLEQVKKDPENCENKFTKDIQTAGKELEKEGLRALQSGVYAALLGPSYETLVEIEMLRRLKADAVGMSTVPELLTAKGTGTEAAAVSVITNVWQDDVPMGGHEEVLEASREASTRLNTLLKRLVNETSS